jgi:cob(I)alamin adenosyltransferase
MGELIITTKGGDRGTTSLCDGTRVPKDHPRVELYGTLDECQAHLGMARATCDAEEIAGVLLKLEENLSLVMGSLARCRELPEPDPAFLEAIVESAKSKLTGPARFVRPGDSVPGAALHSARTVARRAERVAVGLYRTGELTEGEYVYLNRLSDAIYALSLWIDQTIRERGRG